jgi:hypothetical protein
LRAECLYRHLVSWAGIFCLFSEPCRRYSTVLYLLFQFWSQYIFYCSCCLSLIRKYTRCPHPVVSTSYQRTTFIGRALAEIGCTVSLLLPLPPKT